MHDPLLLLEVIVLWLMLYQLGNYQEEGGWEGGLVLNKAQACNGTDRAKKNQPGVVSSLRPAAKAARVSPRPKGKGEEQYPRGPTAIKVVPDIWKVGSQLNKSPSSLCFIL